MQQKIMAIINPVSSSGKTAKLWPEYEKYFHEQGLDIDKCYTAYPGHAIELSRDIVSRGYRTIMAVGGDGTINEIVNGLYKDNKILSEEIRLVIFSQGTGSDYIKSLGISNSIEDVVKVINRNKIKRLDIGQVSYLSYQGNREKRLFVNLADTGIGAATAKRVNESSKVLGGFLTYLIGILRTLVTYKNKKMKIIIDKREEYSLYLNSVMVANGKFFGGGIKIAPEADLQSGKFNIVFLKNFSKPQIIINLIKAYKGTHLNHPQVDSFFGKDINIEVQGDDISELEIDGESVGLLPARFQLLEKTLPVLV